MAADGTSEFAIVVGHSRSMSCRYALRASWGKPAVSGSCSRPALC